MPRVSVTLWNHFTHELGRGNTCRSLGTSWGKAILRHRETICPISQMRKCELWRLNKEVGSALSMPPPPQARPSWAERAPAPSRGIYGQRKTPRNFQKGCPECRGMERYVTWGGVGLLGNEGHQQGSTDDPLTFCFVPRLF